MAVRFDAESVVICTATSFLVHFEAISDPYMDRCCLYPLVEILFLSACAFLAGADGPTDREFR